MQLLRTVDRLADSSVDGNCPKWAFVSFASHSHHKQAPAGSLVLIKGLWTRLLAKLLSIISFYRSFRNQNSW
jgi:hypothetical protein